MKVRVPKTLTRFRKRSAVDPENNEIASSIEKFSSLGIKLSISIVLHEQQCMNGPGKTANCNVVGKAGYEGWIGSIFVFFFLFQYR